MSRKYNYIGYTSKTKKTPSLISGKSTKEVESLGLSFFCSCGSVTKVVENVKNSSMEKATQDGSASKYREICKNCNGEHQSDITISLNSKLRDNVIKSNYNIFTDGDLIKLVRFDDLLGVNSSGKSLYMITNKSSICFNKKTKRFYYYRSYRKGNKVVGIGLRDISTHFHEFMWRLALNQKVCFNEVNKVHLFRNIYKDYVKPFSEFLNILLQFIDKRDVVRLTHFLEPLKLSDIPTINQLSTFLVNGDINLERKDLTNSVIKNFQLVISLIQYPNLSVLLFNLKRENYTYLIEDSSPVSFFKKRKDLSQREIVKNLYIGKLNYHKQIKRNEFKYIYNNKEGLAYSVLKKKFSKILGPEHFSKYKIDIKSLEDFATKNKLTTKPFADFDPFDFDGQTHSCYNTLQNLKLIEQTGEYIKFVRKNKLPKYIVKDFIKSPEGSLMKICQNYYLMLYNEILDESEFCSLAKSYGLIQLSEMLSDYFNIIDYHDSYNYVSSYEDAKENAVFVKHFMKLFFNDSSHKDGQNGYYRSNFIRIYKDTVEISIDRELGFEEILKCKTPNEIQAIHDHWSQIISLERMSKFNDGIKSFSNKYFNIKEYLENNIEFRLIDNVVSLSEEGTQMRHCVKGYARGMSEGRYLIFSVKDLSNNERATLQFGNRKESSRLMSWTFEQLKGKHNSKSSERIIDSIKLFVENFLLKNDIKVNITYKEWDLVKGDTEKRPLRDGRELDLVVDQQIDNVIEDMDWILDNDLPF